MLIQDGEALKETIKMIQSANDKEIQDIMLAVQQRYETMFPQWDVIYMALPKGKSEKRKEILQFAFDMLDCEDKTE